MKTRVGIVGATGYTGLELLRLLIRHPKIEVTARTISSPRVSLTEVKTLHRTFDFFTVSDEVIRGIQGSELKQHISLA